MAVTAVAYGTQSAVVTTEHVLYGSGAGVPGVYTFHVNLTNLSIGDTLELRVYQMILTGTGTWPVYFQSFSGIPDVEDIIQVSAPIANELTDVGALQFSLKQTIGTSRDFDWKVLLY